METSISLPDPLYERVCALASRRGVSVDDFVREALQVQADAEDLKNEATLRLPFIGIVNSGHTDTSQRASDEGLPGLHPWRS